MTTSPAPPDKPVTARRIQDEALGDRPPVRESSVDGAEGDLGGGGHRGRFVGKHGSIDRTSTAYPLHIACVTRIRLVSFRYSHPTHVSAAFA